MNTGAWIKSTPELHSQLINNAAVERGSNFRRIIKMIKHWNHNHGDVLSSYHIEVLALNYLTGSLNDMPWAILQFLTSMTEALKTRLWHQQGYVDDYLTPAKRAEEVERISKATETARMAWYMGSINNNELAINKWHQFFGAQFPTYG